MAYKVKKNKTIKNSIELSDGTIVEYSWKPSNVSSRFIQSHNQLIRLTSKLKSLKDDPQKLYQEMGEQCIEILILILGEEKAAEVANDFTQDEKIDFAEFLMDFVEDEIQPEIEKFTKNKLKKAKKYMGK